MESLDDKFRHLEIFPGVAMPITYDQRDEYVRAVLAGQFASLEAERIRMRQEWTLNDGDTVSYIRDLLGLPSFFLADEVADMLFDRRALAVGLPAGTAADTVLATEVKFRHSLTLGQLRRERDLRNGKEPIVNGNW